MFLRKELEQLLHNFEKDYRSSGSGESDYTLFTFLKAALALYDTANVFRSAWTYRGPVNQQPKERPYSVPFDDLMPPRNTGTPPDPGPTVIS